MSVVVRRAIGVPRQAWWGVLALLLLMGGWVVRPMLRVGGSIDEAPVPGGLTPSEQSLDVLDAPQLGPGAPGGPIDLSMEGSSAFRRSPPGSADPLELAASAGHDASKADGKTGDAAGTKSSAGADGGKDGTLASALEKAAQIGKGSGKDAGGWGGQKTRTGFSPPRAGFGGLSGLSGGGGTNGGSGASFASAGGMNPFGSARSDPSENAAMGLQSGGLSSPRIKAGTNRNFNFLKGAEAKAQLAAGTPNMDKAAGYGSRTYDAGAARGGMSNAGNAGGIGGLGTGVPDNLKVNDPKLADRKEIIPPVAPEGKKVDDGKELEQMITMMLLQAAIGGVLGPVFGGMGMAMAGSMGLTPPDGDYGNISGNNSMDKVNEKKQTGG